MKVEWPSQVIESFCIYEFTNLRIYCGIGGLQELIASTGRRLARISLLYDVPGKIRGIADARSCRMNPQAEALKKRTFKFGLQVVYFCRELRKTWEGDEFADQLFRSGTRVGANYRSACRGRSHDDFVAKLGHAVEEADESVYWLEMVAEAKTVDSPRLPPLLAEANELSAILNQSQVTARANQARRRGGGSPIPNPQSTNKFVNS
jgi:four helix bundle protein